MVKLNSTKLNSAKFEELDLDLLYEISAGMTPPDGFENLSFPEAVFIKYGKTADGISEDDTEALIAHYAAVCGLPKEVIQACAALYSQDPVAWWEQ